MPNPPNTTGIAKRIAIDSPMAPTMAVAVTEGKFYTEPENLGHKRCQGVFLLLVIDLYMQLGSQYASLEDYDGRSDRGTGGG